MSRRYGRNQRRRAREQAAALERLNETLAERASDLTLQLSEANGLLVRVNRENTRLTRTLERVVAILPENHSALPPDTREGSVRDPRRPERLAPIERMPDFDGLGATAIDAKVMRVVEAYALIMGASCDPFTGAVHYSAEFDGVPVAYRMTREHVANMLKRRPELLEQDIAQQMARVLVDELRKAGR